MLSPVNQLAQYRHEISATCRRVVLLAWRPLQIATPLDQPGPLESVESVREDVAGDSFRRCEEVREALLVIEEQVAHDEKGPTIAEQIKRTGDGTTRTLGWAGLLALRTCWHAFSVTPHLQCTSHLTYNASNLHCAS